jgi:hypothetical protein
MICIYFASYVNANPERFAHVYVNDPTNKLLTIENESREDNK